MLLAFSVAYAGGWADSVERVIDHSPSHIPGLLIAVLVAAMISFGKRISVGQRAFVISV